MKKIFLSVAMAVIMAITATSVTAHAEEISIEYTEESSDGNGMIFDGIKTDAIKVDEISTPDEVDIPVTPEEPQAPVTPEEPQAPVTPEEPQAPVTPEEPQTPVTPEEPQAPVNDEVVTVTVQPIVDVTVPVAVEQEPVVDEATPVVAPRPVIDTGADLPKTGDESSMMFHLMVMILSGICLVCWFLAQAKTESGEVRYCAATSRNYRKGSVSAKTCAGRKTTVRKNRPLTSRSDDGKVTWHL